MSPKSFYFVEFLQKTKEPLREALLNSYAFLNQSLISRSALSTESDP